MTKSRTIIITVAITLIVVLLLVLSYRLGRRTNSSAEQFDHGKKLAEKGHYKESILELNKWVDSHPGDLWAWGYLAMDHERLGQYEAAIDDYTFMLKFGPNADVLTDRACAYLTLKDYQHAIDDCNSALAKLSSHTKALITRGRAYSALGKYDDAIADFTQTISIDEKSAAAYHYRALAYEKLGKLTEQKTDNDKAGHLGYLESVSNH